MFRRREIIAAGLTLPLASACATTRTAGLRNPLILQRADPQILRVDGWHYFMASVPEYDRLALRRARTIAGLATAPEAVVWRRPATGRMGGQFLTPWDTFTLDSTVFEHKGTRYASWAQHEPGIDTNSNLYLAPLASPITLAAPPVRLSVPELDWEIQGFKVNEGPAVLARNGRLFMTYSASATDDRYCVGLLTARADADIMAPKSWAKSPVPVFVSSEATGVYGPGHNSFVVDEHGRDLIVYHGRDYREIDGDPLYDPNRHTRVQPVRYRADGTPDFGVPVRNGPLG